MKNKRKLYLINPSFQIKFSIMISLLLFISSLVYPIAIYDITSSAIDKIGETAQLSQELLSNRKDLLIILAIWQVGFLAIIFIVSIFFSHRIAGPLFRLRAFFKTIQKGRGREVLQFRKGDYFPEIAKEVNKTFDIIQRNYVEDFYYLEEVSRYITGLSASLPDKHQNDINEINKRLAEIQQRFNII